jgi:uncharacterized protein
LRAGRHRVVNATRPYSRGPPAIFSRFRIVIDRAQLEIQNPAERLSALLDPSEHRNCLKLELVQNRRPSRLIGTLTASIAGDVCRSRGMGVPIVLLQALSMNISREEQRVLHVLAQGGAFVRHKHGENGRILQFDCLRGTAMSSLIVRLKFFSKLRRKRLIESRSSRSYRISETGRRTMRSQADNR